MANLTELADRVEALAGPCREVDLAIVAIVRAGMRSPWFIAPPSFTGSLDAAMMLVPEGHFYQIRRVSKFELDCWTGEKQWPPSHATVTPDDGQDYFLRGFAGHAATPALALCAAALRARGA